MAKELRSYDLLNREMEEAMRPQPLDLRNPHMDHMLEVQAEDREIKRRTASAMEANLELLRTANKEQRSFRWWSIRLSWGIFTMAFLGVILALCS